MQPWSTLETFSKTWNYMDPRFLNGSIMWFMFWFVFKCLVWQSKVLNTKFTQKVSSCVSGQFRGRISCCVNNYYRYSKSTAILVVLHDVRKVGKLREFHSSQSFKVEYVWKRHKQTSDPTCSKWLQQSSHQLDKSKLNNPSIWRFGLAKSVQIREALGRTFYSWPLSNESCSANQDRWLAVDFHLTSCWC